MDRLSYLPDEIQREIFDKLDRKSLRNLATTSKDIREKVHDYIRPRLLEEEKMSKRYAKRTPSQIDHWFYDMSNELYDLFSDYRLKPRDITRQDIKDYANASMKQDLIGRLMYSLQIDNQKLIRYYSSLLGIDGYEDILQKSVLSSKNPKTRYLNLKKAIEDIKLYDLLKF